MMLGALARLRYRPPPAWMVHFIEVCLYNENTHSCFGVQPSMFVSCASDEHTVPDRAV